MSKVPRAYRVSQQIREVIATELLNTSDPRLELISIISVKAAADLRDATVYWTVHDPEDRKSAATAGLKAAKGRLRSVMAKKLGTRFVPNLRFFYDNTLDAQDEIAQLMQKVDAKEGKIVEDSLEDTVNDE